MNPQKPQVPSGASLKRKQQNLWNGDRFCSNCGELIFGQARDNIRICPRRDCQKSQPYMNNMFKFTEGWGRCNGGLCGVILQGAMKYCYYCGNLNEYYWKQFETDAIKKLEAEKKEGKAKTASLDRRLAELERKSAEQAEIIFNKEKEVSQLKQLKDVTLDSDDEMHSELQEVAKQLKSQAETGKNPTE